MRANELIALFERMLRERWTYEWGAAREGSVDCSGAFVWAFAQLGGAIAHGSNTIARKHIAGALKPAREARPGYVAFKRREESESMPAQYRGDGLGDLYHVGLVSADGAHVLNAKGERYGFCSDPLGAWDCAAPLKGVVYEEVKDVESVLYRAVVATSRDPLRVRAAPGQAAAIVGHAQRGETVDVLAEEGDWLRVRCGALTGYASAAYLRRVNEAGEEEAREKKEEGAREETVALPRKLALALYSALDGLLGAD